MRCLSVFASLGLVAIAAAVAESALEIGNEDFSFAKWVDTIHADPSSAMSPEQAIVAFKDTVSRRMYCH